MGHLAEAIMTKSFINPRLAKHFAEKEKVLQARLYISAVTYLLSAECVRVNSIDSQWNGLESRAEAASVIRSDMLYFAILSHISGLCIHIF